MIAIQNIINGDEKPSESGLTFEHRSPTEQWTGPDIVAVTESDLMDVVFTVQAMNAGRVAWSKFNSDEQISKTLSVLNQFAAEIHSERSELAKTLAFDIGMPIQTALTRAIPAAIETIQKTIAAVQTSETFGQPIGNSVVLLGWTDPLTSFCRRVPAIIAAGNPVVVKPSSRAPRTVFRVAQLFARAMRTSAFPLGFFALLNGHGAESDESVGRLLIKHPGFKTIHYIGRSERASMAWIEALQHEKNFYYSGSARNPALIFSGFSDELYLDHVQKLAVAISDPHCFGPYRPSRLFVQEPIYRQTIERLGQELDALVVGNPLDSATQVGALPNFVARDFDQQTGLALSETGHLVVGGSRAEASAKPTLIRDLTNCSTLQSEELAGPWATIASFKYQHEALKYANTSPLGLAAYVLHPEPGKQISVARKIEAARTFSTALPPWPQAFNADATAVKKSGNAADGIDAVMAQSRWRSLHFNA